MKRIVIMTLIAMMTTAVSAQDVDSVATETDLISNDLDTISTDTEMASDFTLTDINGQALSLSSLRGKYVVVDFWGTWCGWCVRGIPRMKEYYARYKDKIEFLSIDCGDSKEKWQAAVEHYAMPWKHVINGSPTDVLPLYGIEGFPTKIVVSPEGQLMKTVVGESPEFYEYIDTMMGANSEGNMK